MQLCDELFERVLPAMKRHSSASRSDVHTSARNLQTVIRFAMLNVASSTMSRSEHGTANAASRTSVNTPVDTGLVPMVFWGSM
jgi:hypothetical protein